MEIIMARKRKHKKVGVLAGIVVVCLLLYWIGSVLGDVYGFGNSNGLKRLEIAENSSPAEIAVLLRENGIIRYPMFFRWFARGNAQRFKSGIHTFTQNMSYADIADELKQEAQAEGVHIMIPEGFELRQIADKLAENGLIDKNRFYDLVNNHDFDYSFLKEVPKRDNRLEGYLFPATYLITPQDDELAILTMMLDAFENNFTSEYTARAKQVNMSTDEIITLASIIEREAGNVEEMPLIASVFYNRLNSAEYPYLQSCATVQYILKERKAVLSTTDTQINSPYNTYLVKGLPAGPIASPGLAAIRAALYPEKSDYYFFVLGNDGKHIFSKTYEEHLSATQQNGVGQ